MQIEETWRQRLAGRVRRALFRAPRAVCPLRVRKPPRIPAGQPHLQRLQPLSVRQGESRHRRAGPLPRGGAGAGAVLLRAAGRGHPALARQHLQGNPRRHRHASPPSGDLTRWARQGVLLLNATLTVRERRAGSHQRQGWEAFTDAVVRTLSRSGRDWCSSFGAATRRERHSSSTRAATSCWPRRTRRPCPPTADSSGTTTSAAPMPTCASRAPRR